MRRLMCILISCIILLTAAGCKRNIPKPETNSNMLPIINTDSFSVFAASSVNLSSDPFYVKSHVNGKDVFIECIIPAVTFRDINANNKAKIIVYVNGKKKEEVTSAAFIMKGLPAGTHRVKLKVVKIKDASYQLQKEFLVTIP